MHTALVRCKANSLVVGWHTSAAGVMQQHPALHSGLICDSEGHVLLGRPMEEQQLVRSFKALHLPKLGTMRLYD